MSWRPARCLVELRDQVDRAHPNRPTDSDGLVGDTRHQAQRGGSDHNPNRAGVVCAWDVTAAPFVDELAEQLRTLGRRGDGRVKYLIWQRRITSAEHRWAWAPYTGRDPHTGHLHLSVSADPAQYDRTDPWPLTPAATLTTTAPQEDDMRDDERQALFQTRRIAAVTDDRVVKIGRAVEAVAAKVADVPADVVDELRKALAATTD